MPLLHDAELVTRLRARDGDAYAQLVRDHTTAMTALARRFLGDTSDAAEAVQDAFVSAFRAMHTFEGTAKLGTWLHSITVNACLLKLRARKRSRFVLLETEQHPSNTPPSDSGLSQAENCERVRAGVAQLPTTYRNVIQLRDLDGLSTEEAAARLGTSCGTVKVRLFRARQALKTILEPQFVNTP